MSFDVFVAYPSYREARIAQLHIQVDDTVEIPAEVFETNGMLMVTLFSEQDGPAWTYPLAEFRDALDRAALALKSTPS